ncbi:MAG: hypothetical protein CMJ83_09360 [Planctomycetes bacterium]|nr:hypothetical protein [Planctomycetota bacterium]
MLNDDRHSWHQEFEKRELTFPAEASCFSQTLIVERGPDPRLLEVSRDGRIRVDIPLNPETGNGHMQTRVARKLPNGNYLVPHLRGFAVKEIRGQGMRFGWHGGPHDQDRPPRARRPQARELALYGDPTRQRQHARQPHPRQQDGGVRPERERHLEVDNSHVGGRFDDACGGQRLSNGNTVICSYHQKKPDRAKLFEVNRAKKVVWECLNPALSGIHEVHVLTTNGKKTIQPPMK